MVPLSMAYGAFGELNADANKLTISYQFQSYTRHTRRREEVLSLQRLGQIDTITAQID